MQAEEPTEMDAQEYQKMDHVEDHSMGVLIQKQVPDSLVFHGKVRRVDTAGDPVGVVPCGEMAEWASRVYVSSNIGHK